MTRLFEKQLERDQLQVSFDNGKREVNEEVNRLHQLEKLVQEQQSLLPSLPSLQEEYWRNHDNDNDNDNYNDNDNDDQEKEEEELEKLLKYQQEMQEQLDEMKQELNGLVQRQQSLEKPLSSSSSSSSYVFMDSFMFF